MNILIVGRQATGKSLLAQQLKKDSRGYKITIYDDNDQHSKSELKEFYNKLENEKRLRKTVNIIVLQDFTNPLYYSEKYKKERPTCELINYMFECYRYENQVVSFINLDTVTRYDCHISKRTLKENKICKTKLSL